MVKKAHGFGGNGDLTLLLATKLENIVTNGNNRVEFLRRWILIFYILMYLFNFIYILYFNIFI